VSNPDAKATPVFVSCSHRDSKWLERLQVHLKPLEREGLTTCWDDTRIQAGADWRAEIEQALASAKAAVLLVSPDFLASDFIHHEELPVLLEAAQQRGTRILPVILSHCRYAESPLGRFQAVNAPDRPLQGLSGVKRDEVLTALARTIASGDADKGPPNGPTPPQGTRASGSWPGSGPPAGHPSQAGARAGPLPPWALMLFSAVLLSFLLGVFAFAPDTLPAYKQPIVALAAALLSGLCGWVLSGTLTLHLKALQSRVGDIAVRATGGVALFVLVLLWWPAGPGDNGGPDGHDRQVLAGTVLDATGERLSGVRITLPDHGLETTTDGLGLFHLEVPAAAGALVTLIARRPDYRTEEYYLAAGTSGISITLEGRRP
jgi:hypothetical protein